jgi:predicted ABC-type ATPase
MPELNERRIIIIAGPNGAGKTTFAREFLPNEASCPIFVDADLIAAGLSPFAPDLAARRAGRLMSKEIRLHAERGESFAFETTLAGRLYARLIPKWRADRYQVHLIFLRLDTPELAIERVAVRVAQGGHNVPEDVIRRRFAQGSHNFSDLYLPLVDSWQLYDNSSELPRLLETGTNQ